MRVVLDFIVDSKFRNKDLLLHKFSVLLRFAALSPQYQFLLITNQKEFSAEITDAIQFFYLKNPFHFFEKLQNKYRLKKLIDGCNADLIIHSGSLLHFKQKKNIYFISGVEELSAFSTKKLQTAKAIFTATIFDEQRLIHDYQISSQKIQITPLPASHLFQPIRWEQKESIKSIYSNGAEFFLYNGTSSVNGEIVQLLKAFSLFKKRQQTNMKLLIPGSTARSSQSFKQLLVAYKYRDDVAVVEHLSKEQLAAITAAAYAVVHQPTSQELVQVQDVIQTAVPLLILQPAKWVQEKDHFLYADADVVEEIAAQLMLLYKNEAFRSALINKSQLLLPVFSPEQTAKTFQKALLLAAAE
jgi:hypothetical protein